MLSNEEWFNSLRSESKWRGRSGGPSSGPSGKQMKQVPVSPWGLFGGGPDEDDDGQPRPRSSGTYRTVCVRLCDGYFFPISYSTTRDRFGTDEATCQSQCSTGARLYVYRNPGEEPENMVDLSGRPYNKLQTAFLYRTTYDASCKCAAHPWEQEAKVRHRTYALEAERKKGSRKAVAELRDLKSQPARPAAGKGSTAPAPAARQEAGFDAGEPAPAAKPRKARSRVAVSDKVMPAPMGLGATAATDSWRRKVLMGN